MRNRIIILVTLSLLIICLIVTSIKYAGNFLVVNQQPEKSDVIIVLSGGPEELKLRMERACFLYEMHYAPYLLFSGDSGIRETMRDYAIKKGIPREAILLEENSYSTYENAFNTKNIMIAHGFKSAIVTSSEYHMRRTKFLFDNIYSGTGISLCYCAVKSPFFNSDKWLDNKQSIEVTVNEYLKFIANALGIYSQDKGDKDILNRLNKYIFS